VECKEIEPIKIESRKVVGSGGEVEIIQEL
jgi:hypothetical protein